MLDNLDLPQEGAFPALPVDCSSGSFSRIVRLDPSSDGELFFHMYVAIPATISYQVFGADCEENITPLTSCLNSEAIAISVAIKDGSDFEDVYVHIEYKIFATPRYDNYVFDENSFIAVAAYDNLALPPPNEPGINYSRSGNGPEFLDFNCDTKFIRDDFIPNDEIGHGTATGGTVIGGYKGEAPLTVVHNKIFDSQNLASYYGALVAINSAIDTESNIINMSWGIIQDKPPLALACAMSRAEDKGIIMITSGGNENDNLNITPQWPAAFSDASFKLDNMLTVGSMVYPDFDLGNDPVKAIFSSYSANLVDVAAYLTSASPDRAGTSQDDVVFIAGTSISAPMVVRSLAGFIGANNQGDLLDWRAQFLQQSLPLRENGHVKDGFFLPICDDFED